MSLIVGMIGLTHPHFAMHLQTLDVLDRVDGVVLCDPDPGTLARIALASPKVVGTVGDVGDLLARSDVSVVLITLPNAETPNTIVRAADAGKHIVCEKPAGRPASDLQPA